MKKLLIYCLLVLSASCTKQDLILENVTCEEISAQGFDDHPESSALDQLLNKYTAQGIPGVSAILYDPSKGIYIGSSGFAGLEENIPMETCHLFPSASISKMYAAIVTLNLNDHGLLDINDLISDHLSADLIEKIPNGNTARIKELLNHSAGIPEHENAIKLTWDAFHNPTLERTSDLEFLEYIYGKTPLFSNGEKVSYSTSGVIIEDMVVESVMNVPHADLFDQLFLEEGELSNTFFSNAVGYPFVEGTVNTYWDVYSNNSLINSNKLIDGPSGEYDYYLGSSKVYFTAYDLFLFMKEIFENGNFISAETLDLMKEIKFKDNSSTDGYGLGLEIKVDPVYGKRYGHQGGSIGVNNHVYWYENGGIIVLLSNFAGFGSGPLGDKFDSNEMADKETLLGELEQFLLN